MGCPHIIYNKYIVQLKMDYIFIKNDLYSYKIPSPKILRENMDKLHKFVVIITELANPSNTFEKDHILFFVENSEIFQEYFKNIIETGEIPENFYMYVDSILHFIRFKYTKEKADDYWLQMVEYQEDREKRAPIRPVYRAW